ncbi:MAG: PEPxxWA-CTERM sorting domain-containing protein [Phenylobacterium sp.]|uniref:PEPxxWA-CTERM sorting domain-containing protein n=1 Tax=Phenylobacterium sp. TaxID=1871053 RepID=UPI001A5EA4A7|nr:PEPxxWA-CTERM sorting domain-containing protein [Phenylobacterium sp.]MBL8772136.1 PEPxxWA-CTERM sorting domain-containing protein [Phenylobacterium sp.]
MLGHFMRTTLAATVGVAAAATAQATTIDFDSLPYSTPGAVVELNTQFAHLGVLFEAGVGSIDTFGGVIILPGDPDGTNIGYMRLGAPQTIRFVDPSNSAVNATTNFVSFDNLGLIASAGEYSGFTARAFDLNGNLLGETTVAPAGPAQARAVFQTSLSFTGIHRITTTRIPSPIGGMQPIDNLTFGPLTVVTPGGVPEPSTWAMMILGFAAAGHILRRSRPGRRAVS